MYRKTMVDFKFVENNVILFVRLYQKQQFKQILYTLQPDRMDSILLGKLSAKQSKTTDHINMIS